MKKISCRTMGGPCDAVFMASTPEEMMKVGMAHLEKVHPDMAADMKKMSKMDPKMVEWEKSFRKTWVSTPDTV